MLIPQQKSQLVRMASCKWSIIGESIWVYNSTTHNLSTWQVVSGGVKVVGSCRSTTLPLTICHTNKLWQSFGFSYGHGITLRKFPQNFLINSFNC